MENKPFLTEQEKNDIRRRCYQTWVNNGDMDSLIPQITGQGFLSARQEEEIKCAPTSYAKSNYFFSNILMKMPRNQFHQFINVLKEDPKHQPFANEFAHILGIRVAQTTSTDANSPDTGRSTDADPVKSAGDTKPNLKCVDYYETRGMSQSGHGKGVVFIIANFTDEFPGYSSDTASIAGFFKGTLDYDVVTEICGSKLENLKKEDFLEALNKMQMMVALKGTYDRFYLFVLSHGNDVGIESYEHDTIPVEDIIRPFQHDKMKSMKGFPKLFFFQACRGKGFVKVAGGPQSGPVPDKQARAPQSMPIESDLMICYSVTESNFSFVKPTGSPFITEVIMAFQKYHDSAEDLGVIMREVKRNLAQVEMQHYSDDKEGHYVIVGEPGQIGNLKHATTNEVIASGKVSLAKRGDETSKIIKIPVRQMGTVTDNLTKKLLFKNPV